ncbi:hypothetical protein C8J57DRAFT_1475494 [Mycena rebaudengoi]|nr:hypothetical protein C8J57DRAFT_1475494 [Mycena rebaudengoi]
MPRGIPDNPLTDVARDLPRCTICNKQQDPRSQLAHQAVCRANKRSCDQMAADIAQKQPPLKRQRLIDIERMPRLHLFKSGNSRVRRSNIPVPDVRDIDDSPLDSGAVEEQSPEPSGAPLPLVATVSLPTEYILTVPHPHALLPATITCLDDSNLKPPSHVYATALDSLRPWAPFRCFADYSFTSNCVRHSKSKKQVQEELDSLHSESWAGPCKLTIRTIRDMEVSLEAARKRTVQFQRTDIEIHFDGETGRFCETYEVSLDFRDPWKVIQGWVRDETLAPHSTWYSVKKYKCRAGTGVEHRQQLFDEPCTGENWWEIDNSLPGPENGRYPSCYLPIHIWLDKGQVSTKVKMHPILIRGLWINSAIRNATGNGGCALLGYITMFQPPELRNIDGKTLSGPEREDFAKLRALIYNKINGVILDSLKRRSHYGDTFRFGDGQMRTAYPGIFIESMDFQELAAWLAMRSAAAKHPCPKCLVPQDRLSAMKEVLETALRKSTKTAKEEVLKGSGLHDVEFKQILWGFEHSDPYKAASYDTLHWTDLGKFGKHLWIVVKNELARLGSSNEFNECLEEFPRWRGLRHIPAATLIDYAEGNVFLHMLKDIEKDFNFLKQHYTSHAADDIRQKGTTNHMTTRIGEAFQQVVYQHYTRTNGRDAEQQMVKIDENEEAMAELDMLVADHDTKQKELQRQVTVDAEDDTNMTAPLVTGAHWRLTAPHKNVGSRRFEAEMQKIVGGDVFRGFDVALRVFLATAHPDLQLAYENPIQVQSFGAIRIEFQSKVDWCLQEDILHCAESFHGRPRHDCVLYNLDVDPLSLARLIAILRVSTGDGRSFDLAYVRRFKNSKWKPRTVWKGCRVVEESEKLEFLPLTYITRGAVLPRVRGTARQNLYFTMDTADDDMFLRLNNIE